MSKHKKHNPEFKREADAPLDPDSPERCTSSPFNC